MLGVVSHDLRNPLSAIAMCSRVLLDSPPSDATASHELAKTIQDSTAWMSRMIQDLLDVSAIEAGVLSIVSDKVEMGPILARGTELFRSAAADRGVTIITNGVAADLSVCADGERLVQTVANLIGNAVKFTPSGGTVTISAHLAGEDVEVLIEDTGVGISEQDLPHVFDRYWHSRGAGAGTGLGLAIAKGIVEAHRGSIGVTSALGKGTRFSIVLPHDRSDA